MGELIDHVRPALNECGDTRQVSALVERLLREGTSADRQLRVLREKGRAGLARMLTTQTTGAAPA